MARAASVLNKVYHGIGIAPFISPPPPLPTQTLELINRQYQVSTV